MRQLVGKPLCVTWILNLSDTPILKLSTYFDPTWNVPTYPEIIPLLANPSWTYLTHSSWNYPPSILIHPEIIHLFWSILKSSNLNPTYPENIQSIQLLPNWSWNNPTFFFRIDPEIIQSWNYPNDPTIIRLNPIQLILKLSAFYPTDPEIIQLNPIQPILKLSDFYRADWLSNLQVTRPLPDSYKFFKSSNSQILKLSNLSNFQIKLIRCLSDSQILKTIQLLSNTTNLQILTLSDKQILNWSNTS